MPEGRGRETHQKDWRGSRPSSKISDYLIAFGKHPEDPSPDLTKSGVFDAQNGREAWDQQVNRPKHY
ncbi:hypothetical protein KIN20_019709 [Parelaphostrongylus tenuis]|uniref:Uncharacterized protein n=1 Tax=Parelaphostrongylus tenuis TaxID=148309 RepID=A0AAD5MLJ9_PARTN|nr:hypothetical protein KIN20_019709 [Parelaphostrongylus tenuis]